MNVFFKLIISYTIIVPVSLEWSEQYLNFGWPGLYVQSEFAYTELDNIAIKFEVVWSLFD